jgi:hypothetical protein
MQTALRPMNLGEILAPEAAASGVAASVFEPSGSDA